MRHDPALRYTWLLERLLAATSTPYERDALRSFCSDHLRKSYPLNDQGLEGLEAYQGWIELASQSFPLRVRKVRGTPEDILQTIGPERPVVGYDVAQSEPFLITERRGRKVRIETLDEAEGRWIRLRTLQAHVGTSSEQDETQWLVVDSGAPLSAMGETLRMSALSPGAPIPPVRRLFGLLRAERQDVWVVVLYAMGVGLLALGTPIAVQALVNTVAFGTLVQPLFILVLLLFAGLLFAATLRALQTWVVEILQRRLFLRVVADLAYRLPRVRLSVFDHRHGPEIVNRFFDVFTVQKATASLLVDGVEDVLSAGGGLLLLAFYHPLLLAFDVVLISVIAFIFFGLGRGAIRSSIRESATKYKVASWLEEMVQHPVAMKLAGAPEFARHRVDALAGAYLIARRDHFRVVFRQIIGSLILQVVASTSLLGLGGWLVIHRQLTLGQLVASELVVAAVVVALTKMGKHLNNFYDLIAAVDKLGFLVDLPLERNEGRNRPPESNLRGACMEFRNVSLAIEGHGAVLQNVSFRIDSGERIAVTGPSGGGKSMLVDAMFALRDPHHGLIEIDGCDIRELHLNNLRDRVALVKQAEIVEGSVADNLSMGRPWIGTEEEWKSLAAVGLHEERDRLPEGLSTRLVSGGSPLSTGQALRLTLARALAGRPAFLVCDFPIGTIDQSCRLRVLDAIFDRAMPWTLVMVSDDPEVLQRCDRVLRVEAGRVMEQG